MVRVAILFIAVVSCLLSVALLAPSITAAPSVHPNLQPRGRSIGKSIRKAIKETEHAIKELSDDSVHHVKQFSRKIDKEADKIRGGIVGNTRAAGHSVAQGLSNVGHSINFNASKRYTLIFPLTSYDIISLSFHITNLNNMVRVAILFIAVVSCLLNVALLAPSITAAPSVHPNLQPRGRSIGGKARQSIKEVNHAVHNLSESAAYYLKQSTRKVGKEFHKLRGGISGNARAATHSMSEKLSKAGHKAKKAAKKFVPK
ncbi:hypothetical protein BDF19DRAFT_462465 [Syncephalis fuscata]|nr:hypothetical protein BDF19DRAFT_462465 [Syncephalis fuscata]